jgi:DNA-binding transcriptional LysR family regulator
VTRLSFFVDLAVPVASFRADLAVRIPEAIIARELTPTRVVVVVPADAANLLASVPCVTSVTPDEVNHTLRRGRPGGSRD